MSVPISQAEHVSWYLNSRYSTQRDFSSLVEKKGMLNSDILLLLEKLWRDGQIAQRLRAGHALFFHRIHFSSQHPHHATHTQLLSPNSSGSDAQFWDLQAPIMHIIQTINSQNTHKHRIKICEPMFLQKETLRKTQDKIDALYLKCFQ